MQGRLDTETTSRMYDTLVADMAELRKEVDKPRGTRTIDQLGIDVARNGAELARILQCKSQLEKRLQVQETIMTALEASCKD